MNLIEIEHQYPDENDLSTTTGQIKTVIRQNQPRPWIAVDGYHFDGDYHATLRAASAKLLVIDDNAHLPFYDADCILNHGLQAQQLEYHCAPDCIRLFGPKYALLRPEFIKAVMSDTVTPPIAQKILVTLGGSDSDNITEKVIEALRLLDVPFEARVLVGFMNPHKKSLQRAAREIRNKIAIETATYDVTEFMLWADMAITGAGGTCWELAALGVPMITLVLAENQRLIAAELEKTGVAVCLGWHHEVLIDAIAENINQLIRAPLQRDQMKRRGRSLVDARGAERVVQVMNDELNANAA